MTSLPIRDYYCANGSWKGSLGFPTASTSRYADGGSGQAFEHGSVYYHADTKAVAIRDGIRDEFWRRGSVSGRLGYPTSKESTYKDGGRGQAFEGGSIYWSSDTGGRTVSGSVRDAFWAAGSISGELGYPKYDSKVYANGGSGQGFEGGSIYGRDGQKAYPVTAEIRDRFWKTGSVSGDLGYPDGARKEYSDGGHAQVFEGGSLYQAPDSAAWEVTGELRDRYWEVWSYAGVLGYPIAAPEALDDGGERQEFENGALYRADGEEAWDVSGKIWQAFVAEGEQDGALGFPVAAAKTDADGTKSQKFERGTISISPSGEVTVNSAESLADDAIAYEDAAEAADEAEADGTGETEPPSADTEPGADSGAEDGEADSGSESDDGLEDEQPSQAGIRPDQSTRG